MNKMLLTALAAASCIAISSNSCAKSDNGGGFTGPSVEIITVEQAKGMSDDTFVILQGNIKQNIGDELYVFTDASGSINIEIDDDDWNGVSVGPDDLVEIRGEIDKGWTTLEIDVDQVRKIDNK